MRPDFSRLYVQLGIRPDCTLEEFKRAYRRRIAELHPDRGAREGSFDGSAVLPDLIALYVTATHFYRLHGRLPGARPALPARAGASAVPTASSLAASGPIGPARAEPAPVAGLPQRSPSSPIAAAELTSRRASRVALVVVAVMIVAVSWDWPQPMTSGFAPDATRLDPAAAANAATIDHLEVGMDEATVLAIQGEPAHVDEGRWDYGPSWLRFERGRLVDWHSSPMQPLRTDNSQPLPPGDSE